MDRGIYVASSAGLVSNRRLDIVAQNLANANTVGYKAERLITRQQEFQDTLASAMPKQQSRAAADQNQIPGVVNTATITDFTQGPVNFTGNPLNAALTNEKQFFAVQTDGGEEYTKAGNFTLNSAGGLVTADGKAVLGEGGPITINAGSTASISNNGTILVDGQSIGKIKVVQFDDLKQLTRTEGTRFKANGAQAASADNSSLIPASVEMANTGVVESMVEMISANKSFESYAKLVQTISELNDQALRTPRSVG